MIVKIKDNSYDEIGGFIIDKVRTIEGVIDTRTLIGTLMGIKEGS